MSDEPKLPRWNPTMSATQGHMAHDRFGHDPGKVPLGKHPNRRKILLVLLGVAVVVVAVVVVVRILGSGPPESVSDVADDVVAAVGDRDRAGATDLLCAEPTDEQGEWLGRMNEMVDSVRFEVSNIEGERAGSFRLTVVPEEGPPRQQYAVVDVQVAEESGRSCVDDFTAELHDGPPPIDR